MLVVCNKLMDSRLNPHVGINWDRVIIFQDIHQYFNVDSWRGVMGWSGHVCLVRQITSFLLEHFPLMNSHIRISLVSRCLQAVRPHTIWKRSLEEMMNLLKRDVNFVFVMRKRNTERKGRWIDEFGCNYELRDENKSCFV